jgi:hypothetical protein
MLSITSYCLPFVLITFFNKEKNPLAHKIIIYSLTGYILFLTAYKFLYIHFLDVNIYKVLPIALCNIAALFMAVRLFYKSKALENYVLTFCFIGATFFIFLGTDFAEGYDFLIGCLYDGKYTPSGLPLFGTLFSTHTLHFSFLIFSLYALLSKEIVPDVKASLKNLIWLIPVYLLLVFPNEYFKYNHFFTSRYLNPIVFVYNLFPTFFIKMFGYDFEINLLYYALIIALSALILWGTALVFSKISNKIGTKPPDERPETQEEKSEITCGDTAL